MSSGEQADGSWHTNQNKSVNPSNTGKPASRKIPTPDERIGEFYEKYPDRALLPLSQIDGQSLREKYTNVIYGEWQSTPAHEYDDPVSGHEINEREPLTWGEAVERLLRSHEENRSSRIHLERGTPADPEYGTFAIDVETRWFSSYQKRYYAQLKSWLREIVGGERPSGGSTEGIYDNPKIVLMTRSGSSVPNGDRLSPVDHARELTGSWSSVYHEMRNTMDRLGYSWQYDRRLEPHTSERGGGKNAMYPHEHTVIVVDGPVSESEFRPIMEKHVEFCSIAGPSAHDLDKPDWDKESPGSVVIKDPDEVENLAAYVASYAGIKPVDLLDRSIEYIGYAAVMNARNLRTKSRSEPAREAAVADLCKQRFESDLSEQEENHGGQVRFSDALIECEHCGSSHGINQNQTVAEKRRQKPEMKLVADGDPERLSLFRGKWRNARSGAKFGESPHLTEVRERVYTLLENQPQLSDMDVIANLSLGYELEDIQRMIHEYRNDIDTSSLISFDRTPEWRVTAVTVDGEKYPASTGTGIEMVEIDRSKEKLLRETPLGADDAKSTKFRYGDGFACYGGKKMAEFLLRNNIKHVSIIKQIVNIDRGSLADRVGLSDYEMISLAEFESLVNT